MSQLRLRIPIAFLCVLLLAAPTMADYFRDQGFVNPKIRTDYNSSNEGTQSNPLTLLSCLYSQADANAVGADSVLLAHICNANRTIKSTIPRIYSQSNRFSDSGSHWNSLNRLNCQNSNMGDFLVNPSNYWVLSVNNESLAAGESAFDTRNPGPPNQSLPVGCPGKRLMGFAPYFESIPGEKFHRAHLVLNQFDTQIPENRNPLPNGAPFMAIGADERRGNVSPVGGLNAPSRPHKVSFKAKVWDMKRDSLDGYGVLFLVAMSEWPEVSPALPHLNGRNLARGVFVALFHTNRAQLDSSNPSREASNVLWNWPAAESFYSQGADFAFIDAEDVSQTCGFTVPSILFKGATESLADPSDPTTYTINVGTANLPASQQKEISYTIDLQRLFKCASDKGLFTTPMPTGELDITAVHWANEIAVGRVALWVSVHDMRMLIPEDICPTCSIK